MSGIGPSELIVLVVVGLLILGPERLPRVATQIGRWVGRARRTANQLRYQLEREITLADIEGKKKEKEEKARKAAAESGATDTDQPDVTGAPAPADTSAEAPAETSTKAPAPETGEPAVTADADEHSRSEARSD